MSIPDGLWALWLAFALLGLTEAALSLRDGRRWARELQQALPPLDQDLLPAASLILPLAGEDPGLEQNLEAYFSQAYPDYQILMVIAEKSDRALPSIHRVLSRHPGFPSRVIIAGPAKARGQKVHNLLAAVEQLRERDRVLVFGDSDIRPEADWMASLASGLCDEGVGASTGFRWYLPQRLGWPSRIRSAWNSGIVGLMRLGGSPFAWGGAMAITLERFQSCLVAEDWQNSLSDDLSLTAAVHRQGFKISFRPRALSFSHEDCSLADFWSWSFRQMVITRVYCPWIWRWAWIAQALNSATVWGGLVGILATGLGILASEQGALSLSISGSVFLLGALKAGLRHRAVLQVFPEHRQALARDRWSYRLLGPVVSLFTLAALLRSTFSRTIEWRGIRYRMVSKDRTIVLSG